MDNFIEFLANQKEGYYFNLFERDAPYRREDYLKHIKMIDEYKYLLKVIDSLPLDVKKRVEERYKIIKSKQSRCKQ